MAVEPLSEVNVIIDDTAEDRVARNTLLIRRLLVGVLVMMGIGAIWFAQGFLLPVAMAFLFGLVLSPPVRALARRGIPEPVTAIGIVGGLLLAIVLAAWFLSGPVTQLVADAPNIAREVQGKLQSLRKPVEALANAAEEVDQLAAGAKEPGVSEVVVREPGLLSRAASGAADAVAQIGLTLVLLLFLLSSGDLFYEKVVKVLPTLSDKKKAVRILRDIEHEVSRYLLTITLINIGLGVAVGIGLWAIGMPTPLLFGVLVALLNFIPYVGGLVGVGIVGAVALVSFDTISYALLAPAIYIVLNFIEGQFVTPMTVGRRLELNNVAIFVALAFWGWIWGVVGVFLAVPFLVFFKVLADNVEGLRHIGEFLAARVEPPPPPEPATEEAKPA